jgi:hypothetical protein
MQRYPLLLVVVAEIVVEMAVRMLLLPRVAVW